MPASKHGEVQTNKSDGRKFITMKVGSNGEVLYQRIYLRTKDGKLARQRARVLDDIADPDEARRLIAYLESGRPSQGSVHQGYDSSGQPRRLSGAGK